MRGHKRATAWIAGLIMIAATWAVLFAPVSTAKPLVHLEARPGPSPQSHTRVAGFELTQSRPALAFRRSTDLRGTGVAVGVQNARGELLCNASWQSGNRRRSFGFSPPGGFPPGRYALRVVENQALGRYAVDVLPARPKGFVMPRLFALVAGCLLVIGGLSVRCRLLARRG